MIKTERNRPICFFGGGFEYNGSHGDCCYGWVCSYDQMLMLATCGYPGSDSNEIAIEGRHRISESKAAGAKTG